MKLDCAGKQLDLSIPQVMGVLNVTPDSFSDGGRFNQLDAAIIRAESLIEAGASIIDIGGESTRPGAELVDLEHETARVIPVVEALSKRNFDVVISVDTSKPELMRRAVEVGAGLINDVRALQEPNAVTTLATLDVPVCLMHMQGQPKTMQHNPQYKHVVSEIINFLKARVAVCVDAGIKESRLLIDPGFGFGKGLQQNIELLKNLSELQALNLPVLIGVSRKSMIGAIIEKEVDERLAGSLAAAFYALQQGVQILRVHDVAETADIIKIFQVLR